MQVDLQMSAHVATVLFLMMSGSLCIETHCGFYNSSSLLLLAGCDGRTSGVQHHPEWGQSTWRADRNSPPARF